MFKKENVGSPAGNEPSRWEKLKRFKGTGEKTVKNRVLLKRGSFSFMITVLTLAVIVLLNFVVSTLNRKVQLEFDMTAKKTNSISAENSKYLKSIEDDIDITVCGKKEDYVIYLLSNSVDLYNVTSEESLLELTLSLL